MPEILGLPEFRRELAKANPEFTKELRKLMRTAAAVPARDRARSRARGGSRMQARSATSITAQASPEGASVRINPTARRPMANAAFWGARRRTGWYARPRYAASTAAQFPAWIGNTWTPGKRGEGPYAINDAIADVLPRAEVEVLDGIEALYARAFPDR